MGLKITHYPASQLISAEYNPRQLTKDQYKSLTDSVKRFGLVDPVIVNKHKERKDIVIGGHQRLRIAKELGIDKIPCVEVSLTYDMERELNVRLNQNTGEWDYETLANNFDMSDLLEWGFDEKDLKIYDDEDEEKVEAEVEISPELFERQDYLLFTFENDFDFQVAWERLGVKKVKGGKVGSKTIKDTGMGRVLKAEKLLELFED